MRDNLLEAHFDESIGDKGRRILCVAGYLMTARKARRLAREWEKVLRDNELPYFHMVDCAHGNKPFDKLGRDGCLRVEKAMIAIAKQRTIKGFAVAVDLNDYEEFMPKHELIGSAYTFCAHVAIGGVASWVQDTNFLGKIEYFFESGHASQREANAIMHQIFNHPELKSGQRYVGHAFVDKAKSPPTQAADMLAWQSYTDVRRRNAGQGRRKDFEALLRPVDQMVWVSRDRMFELSDKWFDGDASLARLHMGDRAE